MPKPKMEAVRAELFFSPQKNFRRPNRANEISASEESESTFEKEKVNKSTSVLHRLWSNEKTTLQKPNFSKTPRFALKPWKLPEGPLWANLWRRVLSHHIFEESAFAPLRLEEVRAILNLTWRSE